MSNRERQTVAKVFWPATYKNFTTSGYIIGWNIRSFIWCVSCVIPVNEIERPEQLEKALEIIKKRKDLQKVHEYCTGEPFILGLLQFEDEEQNSPEVKKFIDLKLEKQNIWLTISVRSNEDSIIRGKRGEIYNFSRSPEITAKEELNLIGDKKLSNLKASCFGYQYFPDSQFIFYKLASDYHFFSNLPLHLDIFRDENANQLKIKNSEIEKILKQINSSLIIEKAVKKSIKFIQKNGINHENLENEIKEPREQNNEENKEEAEIKDAASAEGGEKVKNEKKNIIEKNLEKTLKKIREKKNKKIEKNQLKLHAKLLWKLIEFICLLSIFLNTIKIKITKKIPKTIQEWIEMSATFQQIRNRYLLTKQLPFVWIKSHKNWKNHPKTKSYSINFRNIFFLITIDTLLGILFSFFIVYFSDSLVDFLGRITNFFTKTIIVANIQWLMGWPAGFKLNDNVDSFMGQLFLFYNSKWTEWLYFIFPISYGQFIFLISSTGCLFGLSIQISIISDILWICTLHISWFYNASARIYMHQLEAISGLWKLFRGKKRNVLRNRIDSCQFDIDQLLLGTILFTVLFFLFPTVAIYYLYFTLVRFLLFSVHSVIFIVLLLLNHFPIYAFLSFLFDSSLFSG